MHRTPPNSNSIRPICSRPQCQPPEIMKKKTFLSISAGSDLNLCNGIVLYNYVFMVMGAKHAIFFFFLVYSYNSILFACVHLAFFPPLDFRFVYVYLYLLHYALSSRKKQVFLFFFFHFVCLVISFGIHGCVQQQSHNNPANETPNEMRYKTCKQ